MRASGPILLPHRNMKFIIISGLSGSGKSVSLDTLEDAGYYCIDNLPLSLLADFAKLMANAKSLGFQYAAVGIDARNQLEDLSQFNDVLKQLNAIGLDYEVIYLRAETACLLKRFSETRRKHPLTSRSVSLAEAIHLETERLAPIANHASLQIDTTHTNIHQLRKLIRTRLIQARQENKLSLLFESFGFKHGVPIDADFVFDARCLPNPYWDVNLRPHTGRDQPVIDFLSQSKTVEQYFNDLITFFENWLPRYVEENRAYVTVGVGCTGGQHRSVYLCERLGEHFQAQGYNVITRHREL